MSTSVTRRFVDLALPITSRVHGSRSTWRLSALPARLHHFGASSPGSSRTSPGRFRTCCAAVASGNDVYRFPVVGFEARLRARPGTASAAGSGSEWSRASRPCRADAERCFRSGGVCAVVDVDGCASRGDRGRRPLRSSVDPVDGHEFRGSPPGAVQVQARRRVESAAPGPRRCSEAWCMNRDQRCDKPFRWRSAQPPGLRFARYGMCGPGGSVERGGILR